MASPTTSTPAIQSLLVPNCDSEQTVFTHWKNRTVKDIGTRVQQLTEQIKNSTNTDLLCYGPSGLTFSLGAALTMFSPFMIDSDQTYVLGAAMIAFFVALIFLPVALIRAYLSKTDQYTVERDESKNFIEQFNKTDYAKTFYDYLVAEKRVTVTEEPAESVLHLQQSFNEKLKSALQNIDKQAEEELQQAKIEAEQKAQEERLKKALQMLQPD